MNAGTKITCGILGSGTCRLSSTRTTSSGYLKTGNKLLLIDCGIGVPLRIAEYGLMQGCTELDIHISHRHGDHLLGLFALLQSLTWSDDSADLAIETVRIHCTEEVKDLAQLIYKNIGSQDMDLNASNPTRKRSLEFCAGPNHADWEYKFAGISCRSVHLPDSNNHGLQFSAGDKLFGFTCDATEVGAELIEFLKNVDIGVFDFGHLCNIPNADYSWSFDTTAAERLLENITSTHLIATHAYMRDMQQTPLSEEAREALLQERFDDLLEKTRAKGFSAKLELGYDGMNLL